MKERVKSHLQVFYLTDISTLSQLVSTSGCNRDSSGSVVECLTQDIGAAGSSLTGVTALWSLSKTHLS